MDVRAKYRLELLMWVFLGIKDKEIVFKLLYIYIYVTFAF